MKRGPASILVVATVLAILTAGSRVHAGARGNSNAASDFDNDGYTDLVIGVPGDDGHPDDGLGKGSVQVLYGSPRGVTARDQVWTQDSPGVKGVAETAPFNGDAFGAAVTTGDFDGDGYADLAVGVPYEDSGAGSVNVLYGTAEGLTAYRDQRWGPSIGVAGQLGDSLAAGDFNDDGYVDLAIAASAAYVGEAEAAGAVAVLYGTPDGLTMTGSQTWTQATEGIAGTPDGTVGDCGDDSEADRFGAAMARGDLNGDGYADLAIGVPGEAGRRGAAHVILGSAGGLSSVGSLYLEPSTFGIETPRSRFGWSLAVGDFDGSVPAELAIGVGRHEREGTTDAAVLELRSGPGGPSIVGSRIWHQGVDGVAGFRSEGDDFGTTLAVGGFDGDAYADLAIGSPHDDIAQPELSFGKVNVLFGSDEGLSADRDQIWSQVSPGVRDEPDAGDSNYTSGDAFGASLGVGDYDGNRKTDLAVGVPIEAIGGIVGGAVNVLYAGGQGLTGYESDFWHRNVAGVKRAPEQGDTFGVALRGGSQTAPFLMPC